MEYVVADVDHGSHRPLELVIVEILLWVVMIELFAFEEETGQRDDA